MSEEQIVHINPIKTHLVVDWVDHLNEIPLLGSNTAPTEEQYKHTAITAQVAKDINDALENMGDNLFSMIINTSSSLNNDMNNLKAYVDSQDSNYYNSATTTINNVSSALDDRIDIIDSALDISRDQTRYTRLTKHFTVDDPIPEDELGSSSNVTTEKYTSDHVFFGYRIIKLYCFTNNHYKYRFKCDKNIGVYNINVHISIDSLNLVDGKRYLEFKIVKCNQQDFLVRDDQDTPDNDIVDSIPDYAKIIFDVEITDATYPLLVKYGGSEFWADNYDDADPNESGKYEEEFKVKEGTVLHLEFIRNLGLGGDREWELLALR